MDMLQSSSHASATADANIGNAHFLLGGDMNSDKAKLSVLRQVCRNNGQLHTKTQNHEHPGALHGDLRVSAGIQARTVKETASHFDPRHERYGICWSAP